MSDFRRLALTTPHGLIASGFGSGLAPIAPGTAGSLAAIPFYLLLHQLTVWQYLVVMLAAFVLGVWASERSSRELGQHDYGGIVWDEFVGQWLTLLACPLQWWAIAAGFFLFRLFDVWKPPPISWLDRRVSGGFGIMIDDVVAAGYAWLALQGVIYMITGDVFLGLGPKAPF